MAGEEAVPVAAVMARSRRSSQLQIRRPEQRRQLQAAPMQPSMHTERSLQARITPSMLPLPALLQLVVATPLRRAVARWMRRAPSPTRPTSSVPWAQGRSAWASRVAAWQASRH